MTDSTRKEPRDGAPPPDEDWFDDDDEFIDLTETVDGSADLLGGDGLELTFDEDTLESEGGLDEEIVELSDALPEEEEEEPLPLTEMISPQEPGQEAGAPDFGDATIDLSEMAVLLDEPPEEDAAGLGEEAIDLSEMALLLDELQEDGDVDPGEATLDLSDMAVLLDQAPEEGPGGLGEEAVDVTELSALLEDDEIVDLGEETLELSISLDDLGVGHRDAMDAEDVLLDVVPTGSEDGFVDIDLLLADSDESRASIDEMMGDGLFESLPDETLMLSDDEDFLIDLGDSLADGPVTHPEAGYGDGLLDELPDETLMLPEDEAFLFDLEASLDDAPAARAEAGDGAGLLEEFPEDDDLLMDLDEDLLGIGVSPGALSGAADLPEASLLLDDDGSVELSGTRVLDLSDLVDDAGMGGGAVPVALPLSPKPGRKAPGFPAGTFDLSGINDSEETVDAGEGPDHLPVAGLAGITDEQLERVVERVIRTMFKERIEELIVDAIGKNLSEDIEKMKKMIQENFS